MVKILVIDDDAAMRRTVSRILKAAGHVAIEAPDGVEGLQLFRTERPEIVITDIFMPRKDGFETMRELRREHPSVLILAVSGGSAPIGGGIGGGNHVTMARGIGADSVLAKPFRAEDLTGRIDKLLESSAIASFHATQANPGQT